MENDKKNDNHWGIEVINASVGFGVLTNFMQ